ncbi:GTPase activating protein [Schizosaccharomyces cryophilus OY26]|uniref:GTPase activating protein n=1 Tax=Schizosaccharomyces cryophilus (strain OY26 / ATCC MYA-4695 / CBS 11777 / NBRC 106824 / NRRL Y48691) TaxID=653667 RepID=S9W6E4_SCHCR|nr:GTPase activating protein [Schizosaccharomyces cryophilus OY26]EPY53395.1 GTPase activating protein [Schizosaccharomyces cryophilus OY26]
MQNIIIRQYRFLAKYLEPEFFKEPTLRNANARPREKLQRLSHVQFSELLTDVADELQRRINNDPKVPFLPPVESYHPKRNHARQKLASLAPSRLRDLCMDVYFEVQARYNNALKEVDTTPTMAQPNRTISHPQLSSQRSTQAAHGSKIEGPSSSSLHPLDRRTTSSPNVVYPKKASRETPSPSSHALPMVPDATPKSPHRAPVPQTEDSPSKYLAKIEMLENSLAKSNSLLDISKSELEALKTKLNSEAVHHKGQLFNMEEKLHEMSLHVTTLNEKLKEAQNQRSSSPGGLDSEVERSLKMMQGLILSETAKVHHINELEKSFEAQKGETERWKRIAINAKASKIDDDVRLFTMNTVPMKTVRELISPKGIVDEQLYVRYFVEMNVFVSSLRKDNPSQWMLTAKDLALTLEAIVSSLREAALSDELPDLRSSIDDLCTFTNNLMQQVRVTSSNGALPIGHIDASACSISVALLEIVKKYGLLDSGKSIASYARTSLHPVDDLKALSAAKVILADKTRRYNEVNQQVLNAISDGRATYEVQQLIHISTSIIRDTLFDVSAPLEMMRDRNAFGIIHVSLQELRKSCMLLCEYERHEQPSDSTIPPLTDLAFTTVKCFKNILRSIEDAEFTVQKTQFSSK